MKVENCRVCGQETEYLWHGKLLGSDVKYFECLACGYVQTEWPYWLDHAYTEPVNVSDTGLMARNLANVDIVVATLAGLGKLSGRVVDYAGGYGVLVRLLRDRGVDAFWLDAYSQNLLARGFEYDQILSSSKADRVVLVTAFEAFEHFVFPSEELAKILAIGPNILLSTELIPTPTPPLHDWCYYGLDHGQHIGFYRLKTLQYLAQKHKKFLATDYRSFHLLSEKPVSAFAFRLLVKAKKTISFALGLRLKSKTWQDHLQLSAPHENRLR